jgi:Xaa-Pro aminopeptidase
MATDIRDQLPADYFARNRATLTDSLSNSSVALFFSGRAPRKTADEQYPFFANRNFFYLTGIEQEESTLPSVGPADD